MSAHALLRTQGFSCFLEDVFPCSADPATPTIAHALLTATNTNLRDQRALRRREHRGGDGDRRGRV